MHLSVRLGLGAAVIAAIAALAWVRWSLETSVRAFEAKAVRFATTTVPGAGSSTLFATAEAPPVDLTPTVHVHPKMSERTLRTWLRLQKPVRFAFREEIPLEDFLEYVRESTRDSNDPQGLPIYLDPVGLQEAEKTTTSPISSLVIEGVPLATSLELALKQVGLAYTVRDDGVIAITYELSADDAPHDPDLVLLDSVSRLRSEVAALRWEIAALRSGQPPTLASPKPAGITNGMCAYPMMGTGVR